MEKHIIYQRIGSNLEELTKLSNILYAMSSTDIIRFAGNYEILAVEAALRAEKIACRQRHLVYQSTNIKKQEYLESAAVALDIAVGVDEGVLYVEIPGLMPRRRQSQSTEFLLDPLYYALARFMDKQPELPRYSECVVHFTHIYDSSLPSRRIRDYDNLELKQVLDIIAAFVMVDDGGLNCDVHSTNYLGEADRTMVAIIEKARFPLWLIAQRAGKRMSDLSPDFDGFGPT